MTQRLRVAASAAEIASLRAKQDRLLDDGKQVGAVNDVREVPYSDPSGYGP